MARVHDVLRWANRRDVAREVTKRGYRVSGETLNRWVRDEQEFPAIVERIVFDLFTITGHEETAPPETAERLERIEGLVRAIAAVTPGIELEQVEEVVARVDELERSRPQRDAERRRGDRRTRGGSAK